MSAESEYGSLIARVESRQRRFQVEAIGAKIREVFMHLDTGGHRAKRRSNPDLVPHDFTAIHLADAAEMAY